jgi:putative ABC transport system permease protein
MSKLLFDLRLAFRLLYRSPGFTLPILGVLVFGIGATTAMFSVVDSLFFEPLPYPDADDLGVVWSSEWSSSQSVSGPDFRDWKEQATKLEGIAAIEYFSFNMAVPGEKADPVTGSAVTGDFFSIMAVPAGLGRLLEPRDAAPGGENVAVVSDALWRSRFNADRGVLGRTIKLNGVVHTVVGVTRPGFRFVGPNSDGGDIWIPLRLVRDTTSQAAWERDPTARDRHYLNVITRRKHGVSAEDASQQLTAITESLEKLYSGSNSGERSHIVSLRYALAGDSKGTVWILFAAVLLVYLVVCANVANLLLTRAAARRGDTAVRVALGASRGHLLRQIMTETVVVFITGGLGGALLSRWLVAHLAGSLVDSSALNIPMGVNATALLFCFGVCLLSAIVIGLVPTFVASKVEPQGALKDVASRSSGSRSHNRIRSGLVVAQIACAFALLTGAGLMLEGFHRLAAVSPGFVANNVVRARIVMPHSPYETDEQVVTFAREALTRIAAEAGVRSVGAIDNLPMAGGHHTSGFEIEGRPSPQRGQGPTLERTAVTPGFFQTMGIPILRGRDFSASDVAGGRRVAIINEHLARKFFGGEDPIGKRINWDHTDDNQPVWREIVAVVGDIRHHCLEDDLGPSAYVPHAQKASRTLHIVVRTDNTDITARSLRDVFFRLDPEQAVGGVGTMESLVAYSIGQHRWRATLLGAFSLAALVLASLGLFGLVSYSTGQRTREFAIRAALGSTTTGIVGLVLRAAFRLVGAGLLLGLGGSLLVGRLLAGKVHGIAAFDGWLLGGIPALLAVVSVAACLLPAWRAVRTPPAVALRAE